MVDLICGIAPALCDQLAGLAFAARFGFAFIYGVLGFFVAFLLLKLVVNLGGFKNRERDILLLSLIASLVVFLFSYLFWLVSALLTVGAAAVIVGLGLGSALILAVLNFIVAQANKGG